MLIIGENKRCKNQFKPNFKLNITETIKGQLCVIVGDKMHIVKYCNQRFGSTKIMITFVMNLQNYNCNEE